MPNYSITINSRFRPFSYQELLAPVLASTQAQQQIEENYANLATQASLAGSKANEQTDPIAYARYKAYSDELNAMAEDLAKNGLTPESRRSMYNMRARYAKDIVPIETAYANKVAQIQQQQQAKLQNPTLLLDRDASTTSLDAYLENPNLGYNSYSGALLTQQVSNAVANMAKTDEGRTQLRQLLPYQYEAIRSRGFRPEEVMEAIMGSPNANKILTGVVENVMDASGIKNWATGKTLADAYNYARMGLYSGVGETSYSNITDAAGMARLNSALQEQREINAENRAIARAQAAQEEAQLKTWDPNTTDLYQGVERAGVNTEDKDAYIRNRKNRLQATADRNYKNFERYHWVNSKGQLTNTGLKVLTGEAKDTSTLANDFRNYIKGTVTAKDGKWAINDINSSLSRYRNGKWASAQAELDYRQDSKPTSESYNAVATKVQRLNITGENREALESAIKSAIGSDGKIYPIGSLDTQSRSISKGNKGIDRDQFEKMVKDGTRIKYIGNNPYTNQIFFQMDDGTWYHMPPGVYSDNAISIISRNNTALQNSSANPYLEAVAGNNIMTVLGQPLNSDAGTIMHKSDGTVTFTP